MAIVFEHKGTQYTLEFSRDSVKQLERSGFNYEEAGAKPITTLMTLFKGSFLMHHPRVSQATIDEIWESLGDKDGLFDALAGLYSEPIESLMKEPDEGKKIAWRVK